MMLFCSCLFSLFFFRFVQGILVHNSKNASCTCSVVLYLLLNSPLSVLGACVCVSFIPPPLILSLFVR